MPQKSRSKMFCKQWCQTDNSLVVRVLQGILAETTHLLVRNDSASVLIQALSL